MTLAAAAALSSALSIHKLKLVKRKVIDVRVLLHYFCTYLMRANVAHFAAEMHNSVYKKANIGKQMNMHSHTFLLYTVSTRKEKSHQVASAAASTATFHLTLIISTIFFSFLHQTMHRFCMKFFSARFTHTASTVQENNF